jgi:hypothetical protein
MREEESGGGDGVRSGRRGEKRWRATTVEMRAAVMESGGDENYVNVQSSITIHIYNYQLTMLMIS